MKAFNFNRFYCITSIFFVLLQVSIYAQKPALGWVGRYEGATVNGTTQMLTTTDEIGNIYVAGQFTDDNISNWFYFNLNFDSNPISVYDIDNQLFIIKYNKNGIYQTHKPIAGPSAKVNSIVYRNGNIYVGGYFTGTNHYTGYPANKSFSSSGGKDAFFAALAPNNLDIIEIKTFGNWGDEEITSIDVSNDNQIYVSGIFNSSDFDIDPDLGEYKLFNNGQSDIFFAKYNNIGNLVWAKSLGTPYNETINLSLDNAGSIYLAGSFSVSGNSVMDFDASANIVNDSTLSGHVNYLAKYTDAGNYIWHKRLGGFKANVKANNNAVYVFGAFNGSGVDFNPSGSGPDILNSAGNTDAYIVKYDPNGAFQWVKNVINTSGLDEVVSLQLSNAGDPVFLANYNSGNLIKLKKINISGGLMPDSISLACNTATAHSLHLSQAGKLIVAGINGQVCSFNGGVSNISAGYFMASYFQAPNMSETNIMPQLVRDSLISFSWQHGNADSVAVFACQTNTGTANVIPDSLYYANQVFGNGTQAGSGWYCVYKGTGNTAVITGISPTTTYRVQVAGFNSNGKAIMYNAMPTANNPFNIITTNVTNALVFNGTTQYVAGNEANIADFGTANFTAEAWIQTANNQPTEQVIFSNRYDASEGLFFTLSVFNGKVQVEINGGKPENIIFNGNKFIADSSWHHLAMIRMGATVSLFVDGQPDGMFTQPQNLVANVSRGTGFNVGARNVQGTFGGYYTGAIDEVKLWNRALSPSEIYSNLYKQTMVTDPNLILYYNFNQTGGTSVTNIKTTYNNTIVNGAVFTASLAQLTPVLHKPLFNATQCTVVWRPVPGISTYSLLYKENGGEPSVFNNINDTSYILEIQQGNELYVEVKAESPIAGNVARQKLFVPMPIPGNALLFDGNNDYVEIPNLKTINLPFTFEAWINQADYNQRRLLEKSGEFEITLDNQKLFVATHNGAGFNPAIYSNPIIKVNKWNHVAVTITPDSLYIYINGKADKIVPYNYAKASNTNTTVLSGGYKYKGLVDEVRIWGIPRTSGQIWQSMHKPANPTMPGLLLYYNFDQNSGSGVMDHSINNLHGNLVNFADSAWQPSQAMIIPTILGVSDISNSGAKINWRNTGTQQYHWQLHNNTNFDIANYNEYPIDTIAIFSTLAPNTTYYFRVQSYNNPSSHWSDTIMFTTSNFKTDTILVDSATCNNTNTGKVTIIVSGGVKPYNYTETNNFIPNGTSNSDSIVINNLSANGYNFNITDAAGNNIYGVYAYVAAPNFNIELTIPNTNICASNATTVSANVNGGKAPYAYQWTANNGYFTNPTNYQTDYNAYASGNVTIKVTDSLGCLAETTQWLNVYTAPYAYAGSDITATDNTVFLNANYPNSDFGQWQIISNSSSNFGDTTKTSGNYQTTLYGTEGNTDTLIWTVTSAYGCGAPATDTLIVHFIHDILRDSLKLQLKFDNNLTDQSGNNIIVTPQGSQGSDYYYGYNRTNMYGNVFEPNTNWGYLKIDTVGKYVPDTFLVSLWVKPSVNAVANQTLLSGKNSFNMYINSQTQKLVVRNNNGDSIVSSKTLPKNIWHHIVWGAKPNNQHALFINGMLDTTKTMANSLNLPFNNNLYLAANFTDSATNVAINTGFDDVRLYNRTLTQAEIDSLYLNPRFVFVPETMLYINGTPNAKQYININSNTNWQITKNNGIYTNWFNINMLNGIGNNIVEITAQPNYGSTPRYGNIMINNKNISINQKSALESGLVAYYNNFNSDMAYDQTPNQNNGTFIGSLGKVNDKNNIYNGAVYFNSDSDKITINNPLGLPQFTASALINWNGITSGAAQSIISSIKDTTEQNFELKLENDGKIKFLLSKGKPNWTQLVSSDTIKANNWSLVTATYNGFNANIYINGILVKTDTTSLYAWANSPYAIGNRPYYSTGMHFNGAIDEIRLYNRALSPQEIAELYCPKPQKPYLGSNRYNIQGTYYKYDTLFMAQPPLIRTWSFAGNSPNTDITLPLPQQSLTEFKNAVPGHTYYIVCTDSTPCGNSASDTLILNFKSECVQPFSNAGPDTIITIGNTVQLKGIWPLPAKQEKGKWLIASGIGGSFDNDTLNNTIFTGSYGQTYQLVWNVYNPCGSVTDTVQIKFECIPTNISSQPNSTMVCMGSAANFNIVATGSNLTYQWKRNGNTISGATGSNFAINNVTIADTGMYTVLIKNICNNEIESNGAYLSIKSIPTANAGSDILDISGITVLLNANNPGGVWRYWFNTDSATQTGVFNNRVIENTTFTGQAGKAYNLVWRLSNSCGFSTDTVTVSFAASSDNTPPTAPTNVNYSGLTQTSVTLTWDAATDNVEVTNYRIYNGANFVADTSVLTHTLNNLQPFTQYNLVVKAVDASGNESTASDTVKVKTLPDCSTLIAITDSVNVTCNGGSNGQINASASGGNGNYSYKWYDNSTNSSISNLSAGTYSLTITDTETGCNVNDTVTVTEPAALNATLTVNKTTITQGETAVLTVKFLNGTPSYSYTINDTITGSGINSDTSSIQVKPTTTTIYNLINVSDANCNNTINSSVTLTVNTANTAVTGVAVTPTTVALNPNSTVQLTATVSPSNATNQAITWSSDNTAVAAVDANGLVTGIIEGTATITATCEDGGFTATCLVTVNANIVICESISLNTIADTLNVTQTVQLFATITPSNTTNQNITWSTSNTNVATVDVTGKVTTVGEGTAIITVKTDIGNCSATATIVVKANTIPVTGITLSETNKTINVGSTLQLTATVTPANATDKSLIWSTNNVAVAAVNASGLVTAISKGVAIIVVSSVNDMFTDTCVLTVNAAPQITPESFTIAENPQVGDFVGKITVADENPNTVNLNVIGGSGLYAFELVNSVIQVLNPAFIDFEKVETFDLIVEATDPEGASTTEVITINITNLPDQAVVANFDVAYDTKRTTLTFTNQSTASATNLLWTFGDGKYSTETNPTHTYTKTFKYNVCLKAYDPSQQKADTKCVEVYTSVATCNVNANFIASANNNMLATFVNLSNGDTANWYWDFGDGQTSFEAVPTHQYTQPGFYMVALSVSSNNNKCTDTHVEYLQVGTMDCMAMFDYEVNPTAKTVSFKNSSTGTGLTYYWQFGDGSTSLLESPSVTYTSEGIYHVGLTIANAGASCTDYITTPVQVGTVSCNANFTYMVSPTDTAVQFTDQIMGESTNLLWNFGDGTQTSQHNPNHKYAKPGYYQVSLVTYNSLSGCVDKFSELILVGEEGSDCEADFIYQINQATQTIQFANASKGNAIKYSWNFGDNQSTNNYANIAKPQHQYSKTGYYNVCLSIANERGISNITCKSVFIPGLPVNNCKAQFNYAIDTLNKRAMFVDKSIGSPNMWNWKFGDIGEATIQNPEYTFSNPNYYLVKLATSNTDNCKSVAYDVVNVSKNVKGLVALFGYDQQKTNNKATGYPVDFVGVGMGDNARLKWTFDDGTTDTTSNSPTHIFETTGMHEVCYEVSDPITGDINKTCNTIEVKAGTEVEIVNAKMVNLTCNFLPNPFNNYLMVNINNAETNYAKITMLDLAGKVISSEDFNLSNKQDNMVKLNTQNLKQGAYIVKVILSTGQVVTQMIVKQ